MISPKLDRTRLAIQLLHQFALRAAWDGNMNKAWEFLELEREVRAAEGSAAYREMERNHGIDFDSLPF